MNNKIDGKQIILQKKHTLTSHLPDLTISRKQVLIKYRVIFVYIYFRWAIKMVNSIYYSDFSQFSFVYNLFISLIKQRSYVK